MDAPDDPRVNQELRERGLLRNTADSSGPDFDEVDVEAMFASFQAGGAGVESPRAVRNRIVRRLPRLRRVLDDMFRVLSDPDEAGVRYELLSGVATYAGLLRELIDEFTRTYTEVLPRESIARCPFTSTAVTLAIDTHGLDGPWWDAGAPLRPVETQPATLLGIAGALRLAGEVETAAHVVLPGPGVPWVSSRLLALDGVQAVVREIEIGTHTGWTVAYFAEQPGTPSIPAWGTVEASASGEPRDYDLGRWIAHGRLAWIAPRDESLTLRRDIEGCPYLDITGEQGLQRIEGGAVRVLD